MKCLLSLLFCMPALLMAQNKALIVEGASPNLFVTHTVAAKENYYSVGRMYNISPKEIAPFNSLILEKGLTLNQVVKVPLTAANFVQSTEAASDEALVPVYHSVKEKEGLYRIGTLYNKLPVATIKQWNKITTDAVPMGTKLIVGYLKVKKELSPLSGLAKALPTTPVAVATPPAEQSPGKKISAQEAGKPDINNETFPIVKNPAKEKATQPLPPVKKEQPIVVKENNIEKKVANNTGKNFNGGVFKTDFEQQIKKTATANENGTAAIFKSTSGWEDGKYYCLHNAASPGTIIKVTSNTTGKSVYAKVLDVIPDIKQNNALLIRLSNAAAKELGLDENKFDCSLSYSK